MKIKLVYNKKARVLNTNIILLGAFIFMLIVIPFTKGDTFSITNDINDLTKDDIFKELVLNDAETTTAIITLKNPTETTDILRENIKVNFIQECGKVNSYKLLINSTCESERIKEQIFDIKEVCYNDSIIDNKTLKNIIKEVCYNETYIKKTIYENYTYDCFKEFDKIDATDLRNIKVDADVSMSDCPEGGFGYKIDWIAEVTLNDGITTKVLDKPEWAWWIYIIDAVHLDKNKSFISNIYNETKEKDNIWSEQINQSEYVRVTFERNLNSSNDITIYPRIISGTPKIEIYEKDEDILIAQFTSLNNNSYNKVFLTGLDGTQDTFDLKILNGTVKFDHIIDPSSLLDNLISYWKLDEASGDAIDSEGSNDGTISGGTYEASGKINYAHEFAGADDGSGVAIPNFAALDGANLSISLWAMDNITDERGYIIAKGDSGGNGYFHDFALRFDNDGTFRIDAGDGVSSYLYSGVSISSYNANTWYHIVLVFDSGSYEMYINGSSVDTGSWTRYKNSPNQPLFLGRRGDMALELNGRVDEVGVWGKALTSAEITELYNSGDGLAYPFSVNTAPSIISNITKPDTVLSNTDFKLNLTITDPEADTLTGYVQFYINGSSSGAEQFTSPVTNNTNTLIGTLANANFGISYTLIAEYWAGDGTENTTRVNATSETVYGQMGGTVKDSSNIVVNNAKVIIINQATNTITGTTDSNSTGGWTYNTAVVGTYLVVAYDPNNSTIDGDADPHVVVS